MLLNLVKKENGLGADGVLLGTHACDRPVNLSLIPESVPQDIRREMTPEGCPLISTPILCVHTYTLSYIRTHAHTLK